MSWARVSASAPLQLAARLRQAVQEDLMREKLMGWLESNATITEKAPEAAEEKPKKAAAKKSTGKKAKADTAEPAAEA